MNRHTISRSWMTALVSLCVMQAAQPVATVDSAEAFQLRDRMVTPAGVGHWPLFAGDRVAAVNSSVLLTFRDKSYILLAKNSSVVVSEQGKQISLKLIKGEVSYMSPSTGTILLDGVEKAGAAARVGVLRVAPDGGPLSIPDIGYFAMVRDRTAVSAPIALTYGTLPPGVVTVPGPDPVSAYRTNP